MKRIILVIFILSIIGCHSTRTLKGRIYELSDSEQHIKLHFLTANECRVEQSFKCEKLPDSFSFMVSEVQYKNAYRKFKYSKMKSLTVNYIVFENLNSCLKSQSNYTYIPDYEELCLPKVGINSVEYKVRKKLKPGVILNLIKDSIQIKNDTIFFGYKKVPRRN